LLGQNAAALAAPLAQIDALKSAIGDVPAVMGKLTQT
jgi:hypothetical protein